MAWRRFGAWMLLAGLPPVYAAGVWVLMNRLVLGDALYFLRSLPALTGGHAWTLPVMSLATGAALLPALVAAWIGNARGWRTGAGTVALLAAAGMLAAQDALWASLRTATCIWMSGKSDALWTGAIDAGWAVAAFRFGALALLSAALLRLRCPEPPYAREALHVGVNLGRRSPVLLWAVFVAVAVWRMTRPDTVAVLGSSRDWTYDRGAVCRAVEAHVAERTPYGRVFALGYAGLDLLRGASGDRLVPNMDLHIGALRRAYKGQNLYLLVPRPVGAARLESVFWRYPGIYEYGGDRLLFSGAFEGWHLFEIVTAPTQEQLDEWRRAK
jgi:hypothetical protein